MIISSVVLWRRRHKTPEPCSRSVERGDVSTWVKRVCGVHAQVIKPRVVFLIAPACSHGRRAVAATPRGEIKRRCDATVPSVWPRVKQHGSWTPTW